MNRILLRSALALALAAAALSSQARVRYQFVSSVDSFSLTTNSLIAAATTVPASGIDSSSYQGGPGAIVSIDFFPKGFNGLDYFVVNDVLSGSSFPNGYLFDPGSFVSYGSHPLLAPFPGTLTVTDLNPTPEPCPRRPRRGRVRQASQETDPFLECGASAPLQSGALAPCSRPSCEGTRH